MKWRIVMAPEEGGEKGGSGSGGESAEVRLAKLEKELAEAKGVIEKQKGDLGNAQRYVAAMIQKFNQVQQEVQSRGRGDEEDEDPAELIKRDPISVLDAHLQDRLNPILAERMKADEALLKDVARRKVGEEKWDKYAKEVEEFMAPMAPQFRAKPGSWEEAWKFVRAQHVDDEVEERFKARVEQEKQSMLEDSTPGAVGRDGKRVITKAEKNLMEEFGISDENEWRKWRGDEAPSETMFRSGDVPVEEGSK